MDSDKVAISTIRKHSRNTTQVIVMDGDMRKPMHTGAHHLWDKIPLTDDMSNCRKCPPLNGVSGYMHLRGNHGGGWETGNDQRPERQCTFQRIANAGVHIDVWFSLGIIPEKFWKVLKKSEKTIRTFAILLMSFTWTDSIKAIACWFGLLSLLLQYKSKMEATTGGIT
ncbi:hypothetical protein EV401DRAFT_1894369 [Pisolithus croceorrhizus]|nr:hypothetical protein EV401DRAFT_1894369 [Pisolithus croceorrhizus]